MSGRLLSRLFDSSRRGEVPMSVSRLLRGLVVSAACVCAAPAVAQIPEVLPYQGWLGQSDGNPYDGSATLLFRVYDTAEAPNPVWQEEIRDVPVEEGKFGVQLGRTNPILNYVNDGRTRYLGISVNGEPEATPRQPIGSVPFALYSRNAAYLGGQRADTFVTVQALDQRQYVNEARVNQLIQQAGGGGAGVDEERVLELIRENGGGGGGLDEAAVNALIDARGYVREARVVELINDALIGAGNGLGADQVNALIDARGYLDEDAIEALVNALIDARGYVNADRVNALIDARGYLNQAAIEALIDARVGAAVANIQNDIAQIRQDVQALQGGAGGGTFAAYILGRSAQTSAGRFAFGGQNGLQAADNMCQATFANEPTAHLCTFSEVARAVAAQSWGNNPNFDGVATWTVGPVTQGAAFGTSLSNTCQNFLYNSADAARGSSLTVRLNYQSNGNGGGVRGDVFSVAQDVNCGTSLPVLCCR